MTCTLCIVIVNAIYHCPLSFRSWDLIIIMMNPSCPAGNTKAFKWPSCCHLAYWLAEGKIYLNAGAAFRFMEFDSCHLYSYKELEQHLLRCGVENAFVKGTSGQSIFISLEAFLHFLFGGFGMSFDTNVPIDNVIELRNFVMSSISKGNYKLKTFLFYLFTMMIHVFTIFNSQTWASIFS